MEIKDRCIIIIGAARSGIASALFLAGQENRVYLTDVKDRREFSEAALAPLEKAGVSFIFGRQPDIKKIRPDLIIISPGVPMDIPPVQEARKQAIPVWSEIELAASFTRSPIVAVTGTNGKTTTTALIGQILKDAGKNTFVAGNIGVAFVSRAASLTCNDVAVLETSSFQLENTYRFKPHVAVIVNITPDHLDRHGSLQGYIAAKTRIFTNQDENDWLILNWDDEETRKLAKSAQGKVIFFSRKEKLAEGFCLENGKLTAKIAEKNVSIIGPEDIFIKGGHNLENALAACAAGWVMGVDADSLKKSLQTFPGVEHRLEYVLTYQGVRYINDSKGTNVDAAIKALEAFGEPIILIAGGKGKGTSFLPFAEKIREKAKALVLIGQAAGEIGEAVRQAGFYQYVYARDLRDAIRKATELAAPGDIVLLSPACASYDMFKHFEHRGEVFKELVRELAETNSL